MELIHQIVDRETTIRDAMAVIDKADIKLCIVVDQAARLARTLTDGDIRRALLSGCDLDQAIAVLPSKKPVFYQTDTPVSELVDALWSHSVNAIVLVDPNERPVGLVDLKSLGANIYLSPPHIGETEFDFVKQAMDDNWIAPAGPNLEKFESRLAEIVARDHAVALSSGTAALHLALRVLNIASEDSVYVSDLTFVASVQPVLYQNAQPILIDSEPDGWNMCPDALTRRLAYDDKRGKLPAAIIVVHLYGQSANMRAILDLANRYDIPVIEDAAESLGASYERKPSGSHGSLAAYSFNGNKIITTSGGGALVTDDPVLATRARKLATQGRDNAEHYQHSELSYNYRLSNILAGIGRGQLDKLSSHVSRRREIFQNYKAGLEDIKGLTFQQDAEDSIGSRWLTVINFDPDQIDFHPYQFMRRLIQKGIETRPAWKPMHMQPLCAGFPFEPHSRNQVVSHSLFLRSLCLPSGSSLSNLEQRHVIDEIRAIILEK